MEDEFLYDYLFHYNIYTREWNAFKRGDLVGYFNGTLPADDVIKSKNPNWIIEYLRKNEG